MTIKLALRQSKYLICLLILISITAIYIDSQYAKDVDLSQRELLALNSVAEHEIEYSTIDLKQHNVETQAKPYPNHLIVNDPNRYSNQAIYHLIEQNPAKASALIAQLETPRQFSLVISLLNNWSQIEPEAALDWYVSQEDTMSAEKYQIGLHSIIKNYVKHEPINTFEQYRTLLDERYWDELAFEAASAIAVDDPVLALSWVEKLQAEGMSNEAINDAYIVVMEKFINLQPLDAIEMLKVVNSLEIKEKLVPSLATALAQADLDLALTWLNEISEPIDQQVALASIIENVVSNDETQAVELFIQFAHLQFDNTQVFGNTLNKLALSNSTYAIERMSEIPDELQSELSGAVIRAGVDQGEPDPKHIEWLKQLPISSLAFQGGARELTNQLLTEQPIRALYWAALLTEPQEREQMLNRILHLAPANKLDSLSSGVQNLYLSSEEQDQLQILLTTRIAKLNIG